MRREPGGRRGRGRRSEDASFLTLQGQVVAFRNNVFDLTIDAGSGNPGAIGIEFASFYRTLGSAVTVVEVLDRILPLEDAEVVQVLARSFQKRGVKISTSTPGILAVPTVSSSRRTVAIMTSSGLAWAAPERC